MMDGKDSQLQEAGQRVGSRCCRSSPVWTRKLTRVSPSRVRRLKDCFPFHLEEYEASQGNLN
jgi:hypothetical protein